MFDSHSSHLIAKQDTENPATVFVHTMSSVAFFHLMMIMSSAMWSKLLLLMS